MKTFLHRCQYTAVSVQEDARLICTPEHRTSRAEAAAEPELPDRLRDLPHSLSRRSTRADRATLPTLP